MLSNSRSGLAIFFRDNYFFYLKILPFINEESKPFTINQIIFDQNEWKIEDNH